MARSKSSSGPDEGAHNRLLADIGRDHFLAGKSKVQVAAERGLSRFQVANFIQEALDRGIVRISIHVPDTEADTTLAAALGVRRVVTVGPGSGTSVVTRDDLARTVTDVVSRTVSPGDTVGVAWSRTLQDVVGHLPPMPTCEFVQLAGAISADRDVEGPQLLAGLEARAVWPLWAPLVVEDAAPLRSSAEVRRTLEKADDLDVAVIAIGRWRRGLSTVWERVPPDIRRAALEAGAVAEISGRLLDAEGRPVNSPVDNMVVAATLEQMSRAGHKVAVAQGAERAVAVVSAARAELVDTLVCDLALHEALAALLDEEPPPPTDQINQGEAP